MAALDEWNRDAYEVRGRPVAVTILMRHYECEPVN